MDNTNEDETVADPATEPAPNPVQMVNLIGNAVDNKPGDFASTFDQLMRDRIAQKVADRKSEMSQALFGAPEAGDPEVDEPDEDNIEPEDDEPEEDDENGEPEIEEPEENEPIDDEPKDDDDEVLQTKEEEELSARAKKK